MTRFRPGDEVFGQSLVANLWRHGGAFAEYATVAEARFERKPVGLDVRTGAAVPTSGSLAVQAVRDEGRVQAGQTRVDQRGGRRGGDVRGSARQGVRGDGDRRRCRARSSTFRSWADRTIDYEREDFTRSGERYDVILESPGTIGGRTSVVRSPPRGPTCLIGHDQYGASGHRWFGSLGRFAKLMVTSPFVHQLHPFRGVKDPGDRLVVLKELIEAGKVTPVIDRTFPLGDVPDAIRYLESEKARGKLIVTVGA